MTHSTPYSTCLSQNIRAHYKLFWFCMVNCLKQERSYPFDTTETFAQLGVKTKDLALHIYVHYSQSSTWSAMRLIVGIVLCRRARELVLFVVFVFTQVGEQPVHSHKYSTSPLFPLPCLNTEEVILFLLASYVCGYWIPRYFLRCLFAMGCGGAVGRAGVDGLGLKGPLNKIIFKQSG